MPDASDGTVRIFPSRNTATPDDEMAFVGEPPLWLNNVRRVDVSVTFTWDIPEAERLARYCRWAYPDADVRLGGPAMGTPYDGFIPGRYVKTGYLFTSRGCPNHCAHCLVPQREGTFRTLPLVGGYNVLDSNFLASDQARIAEVLDHLGRQPRRAEFTGGLEASRLTDDTFKAILAIKPKIMYFAYDRDGDRADCERAFDIVRRVSGWKPGTMRHYVSCYLLCAYGGDTIPAYWDRVKWLMSQGVRAFPMYFQPGPGWRTMPKEWHDAVGPVRMMR